MWSHYSLFSFPMYCFFTTPMSVSCCFGSLHLSAEMTATATTLVAHRESYMKVFDLFFPLQIIKMTLTLREILVRLSAAAMTCKRRHPRQEDVMIPRQDFPNYSHRLLSLPPLCIDNPPSSLSLCVSLSCLLLSGDWFQPGTEVHSWGSKRAHHTGRAPPVLLGPLQQHRSPGPAPHLQL